MAQRRGESNPVKIGRLPRETRDLSPVRCARLQKTARNNWKVLACRSPHFPFFSHETTHASSSYYFGDYEKTGVPNMSSSNPISKEFTCLACGKRFKTNQALNQHQVAKAHFKCDACGKQFSSERALQQHQEAKLGFKCPHCESSKRRRFGSRQALAQHIRDIHDVRYSCKICDKTFRSKRDWEKHKAAVHPKRYSWPNSTIRVYHTPADIIASAMTSIECPNCGERRAAWTDLPTPGHPGTYRRVYKCLACDHRWHDD